MDNDTSVGVPGVVVTLATVTDAGQPAGRRMLTDEQGRFVFRGLPKGSYSIATTIGGNGNSPAGFIVSGQGQPFGAYLDGGYGRRRPNGPLQTIELGDEQKLGNVEIRVWKGGTIDGTIFDDANEPLAGVVVSAVRREPDGRLTTGPTTRTDDRGRYICIRFRPATTSSSCRKCRRSRRSPRWTRCCRRRRIKRRTRDSSMPARHSRT